MADLRWMGVSILGGFGPKKMELQSWWASITTSFSPKIGSFHHGGPPLGGSLHFGCFGPKKLGVSIMADLCWVEVSISRGFGPKRWSFHHGGPPLGGSLHFGWFWAQKMELPSWRTSILTSFTQKVGSFHHGGPPLGGSLHFGWFWAQKDGASIMADLHLDVLHPKKLGASIMADLSWVGVSILGGFGPKKMGASIMADLCWVGVSILGGFGPKKMELPSWRTSVGWESPFWVALGPKRWSFHHGRPPSSLPSPQKLGASIMADLGWVGVSILGGFGPKKLGASIMAGLHLDVLHLRLDPP